MRSRLRLTGCVGALSLLSCGDAGSASDSFADATTSASTDSSATSAATSTTATATTSSTASTAGASTDDGPSLDVAFATESGGTTTGGGSCKVDDGMDAIPPCREQAPPDSFASDIEWSWAGADGEGHSGVTPLVVNLTDDNADGEIDLCDTPDVVVVASSLMQPITGHIHVLDGGTGTEHFAIATAVSWATTPAIGDIDGDGLPEIVASGVSGDVVAFEHDGTIAWTSTAVVPYGTAMALADLDTDGDVEIFGGRMVIDHLGVPIVTLAEIEHLYTATTAADLDDDGDLEVVLGRSAFHHDSTVYYDQPSLQYGFPQVADLDDDGLPEVLVTASDGITILEHTGTIKPGALALQPTNDPVTNEWTWKRPATVHDFDGDAAAEFAQSSGTSYTVFEPDPVSIVWSSAVVDPSGLAASTAFDFLGDGLAEAMYADEQNLFVFDDTGMTLLSTPRQSGTMIEYPTVADVDNDGSAEIIVVSYFDGPWPTVQVVRDAEDRWIPARRIWNQHTYHVTNVREDATIPQDEPKHWTLLNTFRTQAQVEAGGVCQPEPAG